MNTSDLIISYAGDHINKGNTVKQRENYLRSACAAWNIACMSFINRELSLFKYLKAYSDLNENLTDEQYENMNRTLRELIKKKQIMYPDVNTRIFSSRIDEKDGEEYIILNTAEIQINA